jgi:large subunit ribosomal protein L10
MPTAEKTESVAALAQKMSQADAIYLADFSGIDVASVTELRRTLREAGVEYHVVKNRLAKLAASDAGLSSLERYLEGPTAMAFVQEDPVAPAKILQGFIDRGGKLAIKTGLVDGQVLTAEAVAQLAKLPSREELIGKVVGSVQSPLYGLSAVLNGLLRGLVGALAAIKDQQAEGGAEAEASA